MATQAFELNRCNSCLVELDIIQNVSDVGVVEEIMEEARRLIIIEMLIVSKRCNAESIGKSPE